MAISSPIVEINVHGLTVDEALSKVDKALTRSGRSVYRIRVIHGFNHGTAIRDALYRDLAHGLEPKVLRLESGSNPGVTELVLREY